MDDKTKLFVENCMEEFIKKVDWKHQGGYPSSGFKRMIKDAGLYAYDLAMRVPMGDETPVGATNENPIVPDGATVTETNVVPSGAEVHESANAEGEFSVEAEALSSEEPVEEGATQ